MSRDAAALSRRRFMPLLNCTECWHHNVGRVLRDRRIGVFVFGAGPVIENLTM